MEVVAVVVLLTVTVCLIITVALAFWPAPQSSGDGKQAGGSGDTGDDGGTDTVTPPTTLEGALTRQLFAGEINRLQYRRALAKLAARDDEQHPMSVPNNGGSDACP